LWLQVVAVVVLDMVLEVVPADLGPAQRFL
jgi:hypothetical protein